MSEKGHSRPMHSVPVPINVRCYSNSDIIVRRREVTRGAISSHAQSVGCKLTFLESCHHFTGNPAACSFFK
jgi:hypothetical protein